MNWIILLCLAPVVLGTEGEFYHILSAKTLKPPGSISNESLFGFSTTYDLYNKRLIISAPRTNNIGDVYDCDLNENSCVIINRDILRVVAHYDHGYWFGATVKSGTNFVTACAPRYTLLHGSTKVAGIYGRCYQRKANDISFTTVITRTPNNVVAEKPEKQMDTLGWTLDIDKNDNHLIGGPSMFENRGLAMLALKKSNKKILFKNEPFDVLNFGYSVVAGHFIHPEDISYAVSTTYGKYGMGQVYFFSLPKNTNFIKYNFELTTTIDEKKIGSMFGAVMCAAKINPNGIGSDLLVGAPTFSDNKDSGDHDTGAVYVYGYNRIDDRPTFKRQITGNAVGSLFGSAIVSLGDLNGDKRDEIAIGAPYEGNGVVYVYSGADIYGQTSSSKFSNTKILQRIESPGYKSFGYSLAALQDYDDNGCNELAISAPDVNVVKLYKCIAAITVTKLYAKFPPLKNRTKTGREDFNFQVCMEFKFPLKPKSIFAELSTDVELKHHYAVLKNPNKDKAYNFKVTLDGATPGPNGTSLTECHPVEFILPKKKDYTMAIGYEIRTTLLNNPISMTSINSSQVILSDQSQLTYTGSVFAVECEEEECKPNLSLTITANVLRNQPLITGSIKEGNYTIEVLNTGEVAYEPCIQFHISGANLNIQPPGCTVQADLENTWKCTSRSPVNTDNPWKLNSMVLDFGALTDEIKTVKVAVKLFNHCSDEIPHAEDEYSINLEPNYEAIRVFGFTDIGNNVKLTKEDIKVGKQFQHKYKIFNAGVTNFKNLDATVELKKADFIKKNPTVLVRQENSNKECKDIVEDGDILRAKCKIEICSKCFVHVIIMMGTDPDALKYDDLQKRAKAVNSTLTLHGMRTNASSTLQLWENYVEPWMLIVAALIGLLLIIILIIILYKCGCLQRQNKKKLQRLKNDVKRQTIRRSMMTQRESQMPDRQQVLESMEETDESAAVAEQPTKCEKKG